jgi:hypothetical protein
MDGRKLLLWCNKNEKESALGKAAGMEWNTAGIVSGAAPAAASGSASARHIGRPGFRSLCQLSGGLLREPLRAPLAPTEQ